MTAMKNVIMVFVVILLVGCGAHRMMPVESVTNEGFSMVKDRDAGMVYLSPDFNFTGYNTLIVDGQPASSAIEKKGDIDPDEMNLYLVKQLVKHINDTGLFKQVSDDDSLLLNEGLDREKTLILEPTLSELEPGNRALRYFVGFGAGAAKAQVEINLRDCNAKQVRYKSSDRQVGFMGGFGGDSKEFLTNFLNKISEGQAAFMKRISEGGKPEAVQ
jgi:hypothetical protein